MTDRAVLRQQVGHTLLSFAEAIEKEETGPKIRVGLTTHGSEIDLKQLVEGAESAQRRNPHIQVILIGSPTDTFLETAEAATESDARRIMEQLLDEGNLHACATMHYPFPVGVATVGRIPTPGTGRPLLLASTTGTSDTHRVAAMVKNALYGIIAAKASGNLSPTLGILNLDGSHQAERALRSLQENGYPVHFAESIRSDGGVLMRGNDLLTGSADIMVADSLTGNLLMKLFSAYTTGGGIESQGDGYGAGIGESQGRLILILSRASGSAVVTNALVYAAELAKGNLIQVMHQELERARKAGLDELIAEIRQSPEKQTVVGNLPAKPPKEVVTAALSGIDVMDLDHAATVLWQEGIYAETGMGCTGPVIMVNPEKSKTAVTILGKKGYSVAADDMC